ncbi:MAG: hypothetical protein KKH88_00190 [Nanoarchaeota archaeon]|nr:hypothetical protein [Nanoarchaeota archaeon]
MKKTLIFISILAVMFLVSSCATTEPSLSRPVTSMPGGSGGSETDIPVGTTDECVNKISVGDGDSFMAGEYNIQIEDVFANMVMINYFGNETWSLLHKGESVMFEDLFLGVEDIGENSQEPGIFKAIIKFCAN